MLSCVEIVYPENRIVVDYGKDRKLWLIGIRDNASGNDLPLEGSACMQCEQLLIFLRGLQTSDSPS